MDGDLAPARHDIGEITGIAMAAAAGMMWMPYRSPIPSRRLTPKELSTREVERRAKVRRRKRQKAQRTARKITRNA